MDCTLSELLEKEIIDINTGEKVGYVDDLELDLKSKSIKSLVIYGKPRWFGLLGREDHRVIPCSSIAVVGKDTILIKTPMKSE